MPGYCAGIVTFNPNHDRLKMCIDSISSQVDKVFVKDNTADNIGLAKALNQLCEQAISEGYEWILTLDQDTIIPDGMIESFIPYTDEVKNAIICPSVYYEGWDKHQKTHGEIEYVKGCMTSGSFTRLSAWKEVGGFRDDFFIDYVDNEFCMKLMIKDYRVLRVNSCEMIHRLGNSAPGRKFPSHTTQRLYYMARNNYVFIREYKEYLPVMKERIKLSLLLWQELIHTDDRLEALKYVRRGIADAKKGIMGRDSFGE